MTKSKQDQLYDWCLEQSALHFMGKLSQEKVDALNKLEFSWKYWAGELDKFGFHWELNKATRP